MYKNKTNRALTKVTDQSTYFLRHIHKNVCNCPYVFYTHIYTFLYKIHFISVGLFNLLWWSGFSLTFFFFFLNSYHESCRKGKTEIACGSLSQKDLRKAKMDFIYLASIEDGLEQNHLQPGTKDRVEGGRARDRKWCACSIKLLDTLELHMRCFFSWWLNDVLDGGGLLLKLQSVNWTKICRCFYPERWPNSTQTNVTGKIQRNTFINPQKQTRLNWRW